MRGFTLLELLIVLFIATTTAFIAFPNLWAEINRDDNVALASTLKSLREEAIAAKKEIFFIIDFKERQFRIRGEKSMPAERARIITMHEDEAWEVFIPSRGTIKEGQVVIAFTPSVQEELIALYLTRKGKDRTIVLNNLSGEVEIEEGKKKFDE